MTYKDWHKMESVGKQISKIESACGLIASIAFEYKRLQSDIAAMSDLP
jgi:transcription initiation factor TFIIIB Brf1 subunit/transcription initiation factor TFIIB